MRLLVILLFSLWSVWCSAATTPEKAVAVASSLIGTTEATGHNDGPVVEKILGYVGLPKGNPYCVATVVYCYGQAAKKNPLPKIARVSLLWSMAQKSPRYQTFSRAQVVGGVYKVQRGDIFIMLFGTGANPNGHTGMMVSHRTIRSGNTVEGNTMPDNAGDQREGGGIYGRVRNYSAMQGMIRVRP